MNSLQLKFVIFIAVVFIITLIFAFLIFRQFNKVGKNALDAKQRQEEYQAELDSQNEGYSEQDFQKIIPNDQKQDPND